MKRLLNNNKALIFIIAVLLIANITMLVFFLAMKPPESRQRTSVFLKNEIGFSEEQLKQYDVLKKAHWKEMRPMIKSMNDIKDNFYAHLNDPVIDSALFNVLSDSIAVMQKALDEKVFAHFRNTRQLCTPAQKPVYDSLIQDVIRKMVSPHRKPEDKSNGQNQDK